jgi:hypothetical protein
MGQGLVGLGEVLSDVFCVSGRLIFQALLDGHLSEEQIAASIAGHRRVHLADSSMRSRIAVKSDRMWRPPLMSDRLRDEGLRCGYTACPAEPEVNHLSSLVHRSI